MHDYYCGVCGEGYNVGEHHVCKEGSEYDEYANPEETVSQDLMTDVNSIEAEPYQPIIFFNDELTNEQYHAETEHISGTSLWKIYSLCLAKWRFEDNESKKTKALVFGTTSHAMMLEPERFEAEFFRMPCPEDYTERDKDGNVTFAPLTSVSAMQRYAKERGLAGRSKSDPADLAEIIRQAVIASQSNGGDERMPIFWHEIVDAAVKEAGERVQVPAEDYDKCMRMREVILANPQYSRVIHGGRSEVSVFFELFGVKVKVRWDRMTDDAEIWDYKTCDSCEPEKFKRRSFDLGYPMKMALQYQAFKAVYGRPPKGVVLLAQEKDEPFIPEEFRLTRKTLLIGMAQLRQALALYKFAKDNDAWTSYGGGKPIDLDPPFYIEREFKHLWEDLETAK